jgi:chromosome segregation ATPase
MKKETIIKPTTKTQQEFAYYSRVLNKPFDSLAELKDAEDAHFAELKAKEDKAATKKADAKKVEDAFKALNAARREYKESLVKLADAYQAALKDLKNKFDTEKASIQNSLAEAEDNYATALKDFTDKYPEGYHLTLKDGDFETTINGNQNCCRTTTSTSTAKPVETVADILKYFWGI